MRPPMNAPKAKHTNVSADVHQTNPCAWASAKPRKTMLPVTFATNTCSQGQVAQCIDQTGDERHQHHGGGEQPVFVILAGSQRASCLCQMQVHVVDGPSVCSFCLSDALAHVRGERNTLRHDTRRGVIHGLSRFRHGVRVRSSSVSREKPPAVIGSGASHDYVVRRMSRLTGRSQAFTRSMPDCTSASTESQDLMKAATPSASSLSVTSLRLMPSSASLSMTAWDSS